MHDHTLVLTRVESRRHENKRNFATSLQCASHIPFPRMTLGLKPLESVIAAYWC